MNKTWFETRKDVLLRNLVAGVFEAKIFFDKILKDFRKTSHVPYATMDKWIGSENTKGSLWRIKDTSHKLFRNPEDLSTPYENLFDWSLGSIFHEAIKLKEDAYKIDSYKPLLEKFLKNKQVTSDISSIIYEHFSMIEDTNKEIQREINNIENLFIKTFNYLYMIFPAQKNNLLLLRFIIDNNSTFEMIFGKCSTQTLLKKMFPENATVPYLLIAEHCILGGWTEEADKYFKEASRIDNKNRKTYNSKTKKGK